MTGRPDDMREPIAASVKAVLNLIGMRSREFRCECCQDSGCWPNGKACPNCVGDTMDGEE